MKNLQKIVGGYIECLTLARDLAIICNEEGILKNLPYNCNVCGAELVGTIIFVGVKDDEFCDIPFDYATARTMFGDLWCQKEDSSAEVLKHRKACDLCLKEKCDTKCEHAKNYTYQQIKKAYDEAISYLECRPIICQSCGRGCFDSSKYCSHCGKKIKKGGEQE